MAGDLLLLGAGLILLIGGGSGLVRGAAALARRLGVGPLLVGLTVVAFGTSTPELVVNVASALRGNVEVGFGNVMGSNIANIGLLLAVAVMAAPVRAERTLVTREIPLLVLSCGAALALGAHSVGGVGWHYGRVDGLVLLALFGGFLWYTVSRGVRQRRMPVGGGRPRGPGSSEPGSSARGSSARGSSAAGSSAPGSSGPDGVRGGSELGGLRLGLLIVGGLAALMAGGELTVRGAVGLATGLGVSQRVVALTVVAVGTSLPELATVLAAARRREGDLAVGTILGSNLYNLLFIWGVSVMIAPSVVPAGGVIDLAVMTAFSLVLLPMTATGRRIGRAEGVVLLATYAGYVAWLVVRAPQ